jgi:TRAP-type mannitol/chloroaromatic compound transport system substrate-binding protein
MTQLKRWLALSSVSVLAMTLGACASGPPSTAASASIAAASDAISHARADNALGASPDIVNEAEQRLSQAQGAVKDGDNETAIRLANEAKADADLADATAQADQAEKAAGTVNSDIGTLNQATAPQ